LAASLLAAPLPAAATLPAFAQAPTSAAAACARPAGAAAARGRWPAPLDRVLALREEPAALRAALDRLAQAARVRLSYSPDLLPLDRPVCVRADGATLGDALAAALDGTGVAPVVAGADQVVLAPARASAALGAVPLQARSTGRLQRVVVTGTATGSVERSSPYGLTVLEGRALERESARSVADVLNGSVPGLWLWTQSPTSALARFGSVRGASSFGVTTPKVYIDGIEVANPLVLTQLDPARVQRIEVIRGPQGAALYGADAISGVVQIVTRHDGVGAGAPRAQLRGSAGSAASAFADGGVLSQDHALVVRAGSAARSASLGATVTTLGAFVPGAAARQLLVHGGARQVGARAILTGTARLYASDADAPASPLLPTLVRAGAPPAASTAEHAPARARSDRTARDTAAAPLYAADSASPQRARQYTLGGSATFVGSPRWTHAVIAGLDGYRLAGVAADGMLVPSAVDSALRAARGGADRFTLRASSTVRGQRAGGPAASLTLGAEHSTAREATNGEGTRLVARDGRGAGTLMVAALSGTSWWSSTGALAQGQLAWGESFFLNGGGRVERIAGPASGAQVALLPMLGASWVREAGPLTAKLRAAYGRGIRPARTVARGATWAGGRVTGALTSLDPESQEGVEAGVDLYLGSRLGVQATRFDQRASGLVQPVALVVDSLYGPRGPVRGARIGYELQDVGAIDNRGWEVQANATAGPLGVSASLALVSSKVARLASGYRGDLRADDRVLEVPARTLGLTAQWTSGRWTLASTVTRADDWINYDRLALADAVGDALAAPPAGPSARVPVGTALRSFWRRYDGVTRVGARATVALFANSALTLVGENLLDRQTGEPDNVTVLPGRTVRVGLRTGF
jgi:iron complex outermembrane receptor protein